MMGVLRRVDEKNRFMPTIAAAEDYWFYVDPVAMLESRGYSTGDSDATFVELTEPLPDNVWPYPHTGGNPRV